MSENNNEQFKMPPKSQEANGQRPRNGYREGQGFQGLYKEAYKVLADTGLL